MSGGRRKLGLEDGDSLTLVDTNEASVSNTLLEGSVAPVKATSGDAGFAKFRKQRQQPVAATADTDAEAATRFQVGQQVTTASGLLGVVRFVGVVAALPAGWWCGVELETASGKNDGEVKGVRLFTCAPNYGTVMRPSTLSLRTTKGEDHEEL